MVGFTPTGEIINTSVIQHKETPGLGTKMSDPKFYTQFQGANPESFKLQVKKDRGRKDYRRGVEIGLFRQCCFD